MPNNLMLIIALAAPIALLTVLRINAAMVFLSLCLGYVLVQFVANDTDSLISFVAPNTNSVSASTLKLAMLLTPVVLTCLIMVFSIHGRLRTALNILPAAGAGVLAMLLAVPLFTPGLRYAIQSLPLWHDLSQAQAMIIGASSFTSLLFLWTQRRGFKSSSEDKHSR